MCSDAGFSVHYHITQCTNDMSVNSHEILCLSRFAGSSLKRRIHWEEQANQFQATQGQSLPTSHPGQSPLVPLVLVPIFPSLPAPLEWSAQSPPSPLSQTSWACLMRTFENSRSACFHLPPRSEFFLQHFIETHLQFNREVNVVHSRKTQIKFSDEDFVTINPDDQAAGNNT